MRLVVVAGGIVVGFPLVALDPQLAARVARSETVHIQLVAPLISADQQQAVEERHATVVELATQVGGIAAAKSNGTDLTRLVRDLQQALDDLEVARSEERHISSELDKYASLLGVAAVPTFDSFQTMSAELLESAEAQVARLTDESNQYQRVNVEAARLVAALEHESEAIQRLADIAEHKKLWDDRVAEAKRRQRVAKEVYEAATQAHTNIFQRVFTESLNEDWKTAFTRLAPNEGFIPSFGIPSPTKNTFDINLETTQRNGEASGLHQMILSAGNLNTAALSPFLALHLAVEPLVTCLVFDNPVQAMYEVHVAQFAALIRLLSKQNERQVVVAVHERELFEYLALELSPSCEGDELITIELGERNRRRLRHHPPPLGARRCNS